LLKGRLLGIGRPDDVLTTVQLRAAYGGQLRLIQTQEGMMALGDTCCEGDGHDHIR